MFNREPKDENHPLDATINKLISSISHMTEGDEAHTQAIASLKTLMELRNADKAETRKWPVSPEVVVAAGAHILGIVMILGFEQRHVLTSKAMNFVPKIRI